jgi:hypothetical protein
MDNPLRILDLFSGLNGWGDPFREAGHEVFAIDVDTEFEADAYLDIGDVGAVLEAVPWRPDVILASPPCNAFSTGSRGKMWMHGSHPSPKRSDRHPAGHPIAVEGMRLVSATLRLIAVLQPTYWVIENPRGRLRSLDLLAGVPRATVWYRCLGLDRAKPTDLWGVFPPGLELPQECHNRQASHSPRCVCRNHVAAPRGSRTGTQGGVSTAEAGRIPRELAERFRIALELAASDEPWRQGPTVRLHGRLPLRQEGHTEGTPMS